MPKLAIPLLGILVFEFAVMVYTTLWVFWTHEVYDWPKPYVGLSLAAYSRLLALVQGGLMRFLIYWIGDFRTLIVGVVAARIAMIGFGFTDSVAALVLFLLLAALSDLIPALLTGMAANQADEHRQGVEQGVIASFSPVIAIFSPLVMKTLFQASLDDEWTYFTNAAFLIAAALVATMIPLVLRLRGHATV